MTSSPEPQRLSGPLPAHAAIARALRERGVDTLFGLIGDANLFMVAEFQQRGGRYVPVFHEASSVLAALGYASVTGTVGVATVTHGPGLANTVGALIEGVKARIPIILITGQTPEADREHLQRMDQRSLIEATGAGFVSITRAEDILTALGDSWQRATSEHRPIVLNIDASLMWDQIASKPVTSVAPVSRRIDPEEVDAALDVLVSAQRPVVVAGRGAITADAKKAVIAFAERIGAPVMTTLRARSLFAGHSHDLGIMGGLSSDLAEDTVRAADCVIAFGASLNTWTTVEGSLLENASIIQIDTDPEAIGCFTPVAAGIIGDVAPAAKALMRGCDERAWSGSAHVTEALADAERHRQRAAGDARAHRHAELLAAEDRERCGTVDVRAALAALDDALPAERIVVVDAGRFARAALPEISVTEPRNFVHGINFGSVGVGMAYALGAAVGAPDKPVLLVCGDGGFLLGGMPDFITVTQLGLDVTVAIVNDGAYGAEHIQLRRRGYDPAVSLLSFPDLAFLAEHLGGHGVTVRSLTELDEAVAGIRDMPKPVLLDLRADVDQLTDSTLRAEH